MNELYRGHEIVMLDETPRSAVIIERETGTPLPTKVTANPNEGEPACLRRARQLIDIYLDTLPRHAAPDDASLRFHPGC